MSNKNKIISFALSLTIALMPAVVFADITSTAVVNKKESTVNISGKIEDFAANTDITVTSVKRIDNKGLEANKIYNLSDEQRASLYVKQIPVSSDGTFSVTFTPGGKSGKYDYYVNCTDNKKAYKDSFIFVDAGEEEKMLTVFNESSVEEICTEITKAKDGVFCTINNLLGTLSPDDLDDICTKIHDKERFESFVDAKVYISQLAAICDFKQNKNLEIFFDNAENLNVTENDAFKILLEDDDSFKNKVSERLSDFSIEDDFAKKISESVYLTMIETAGNYTEINGIISAINEHTDIDVSDYFKLENTKQLDKLLIGKSYTAQKLSEEISEYEPKETSTGSSGGSAGKNRSPSNKGTISSVSTMPVVTEQPANNKECIFKDLNESHWAYKSIEVLYKKGVLNGYADGNFRADNYITREEFVKVAMESFSLAHDSQTCNFEDVPEESWSIKYIAGASALGIVSGRSEKVFAPKENITREEAAHIIYNIILLKNHAIPKLNEIKHFSDIDKISDFARGSFLTLCAGGIINGYVDNTLRPQNYITRGECAKLITNTLKNIR